MIRSVALSPIWLIKCWPLSPTMHAMCWVGFLGTHQHRDPCCNDYRYLAVLILLPQRAQLPFVVFPQLLLLCGQVSAHLLLPLILPLQARKFTQEAEELTMFIPECGMIMVRPALTSSMPGRNSCDRM